MSFSSSPPIPFRRPWPRRLGTGILMVLAAFSARASDQGLAPGERANLAAPALARTASSLLLLWDRWLPAPRYEILRDGVPVGETGHLSYLAEGLEPGRSYRFAVRALGADGRPLGRSGDLAAATRPAGPVSDVRAHGARGDGRGDDTAAIQGAIDACAPGGTVLVPPGDYRVGPLELKSEMTLDLAAGATLHFLGRGQADYGARTLLLAGPDGAVPVAYGALLTAVHAHDLTLMGGGAIDADGESWWPHAKDYRPHAFDLIACRNLLVQDIAIVDPPSWDLHALYADDAVFAGVSFLRRSIAPSVNADGLDLDSAQRVLVTLCHFGNQDDSIAIKSGKLALGQDRRQRPSEDIMIRDCRFDGTITAAAHPLGVAVGSELCGGARRIRMRDCEFVDAASIIDIKANRDRRDAVVEDVTVENCTYLNRVFGDEPWNRAPIAIDLFYYSRPEDPDLARPDPAGEAPLFRNFRFRHISIENPKGRAIYVTGLPERPVRGLVFEDISADSRIGFFARNAEGVKLERVAIRVPEGPAVSWGGNVSQAEVDGKTIEVPR